jgi:hypothetical protein
MYCNAERCKQTEKRIQEEGKTSNTGKEGSSSTVKNTKNRKLHLRRTCTPKPFLFVGLKTKIIKI